MMRHGRGQGKKGKEDRNWMLETKVGKFWAADSLLNNPSLSLYGGLTRCNWTSLYIEHDKVKFQFDTIFNLFKSWNFKVMFVLHCNTLSLH